MHSFLLSSEIDLITAGVTDGVSLGHPCCSVHDCKVPLAKQMDRFCPLHSSLAEVCAVEGCSQKCERPFKTCSDTVHWAFEERKQSQKKAMNQLRAALVSAGFRDPLQDQSALEEDNEIDALL